MDPACAGGPVHAPPGAHRDPGVAATTDGTARLAGRRHLAGRGAPRPPLTDDRAGRGPDRGTVSWATDRTVRRHRDRSTHARTSPRPWVTAGPLCGNVGLQAHRVLEAEHDAIAGRLQGQDPGRPVDGRPGVQRRVRPGAPSARRDADIPQREHATRLTIRSTRYGQSERGTEVEPLAAHLAGQEIDTHHPRHPLRSRSAGHLGRGAALDHPSAVDEHERVRQRRRVERVVGHEHTRDA